MVSTMNDIPATEQETLISLYNPLMRALARRAVRVWFNQGRLDTLFSEAIEDYLPCDTLYAIDTYGFQVSSNVSSGGIDTTACGQDLSQRPYHVTIPLLNNAAYQGVFVCDAYISCLTQRPCVTVMRGVTTGPVTLGFLAADLDAESLPPGLANTGMMSVSTPIR